MSFCILLICKVSGGADTLAVYIDHFFRCHKEVLKLVTTEIALCLASNLSELYFNLIISHDFVVNKPIIAWLHEIGSFHLLWGKSGMQGKYSCAKFCVCVDTLYLITLNVYVQWASLLYFNQVFILWLSIQA